jgi:hypothetical protein
MRKPVAGPPPTLVRVNTTPSPPAAAKPEADPRKKQTSKFDNCVRRNHGSSALRLLVFYTLPIHLGHQFGRGYWQTISLPVAKEGVLRCALEPPHEQLLAKMAFAEQQQWIIVQQKTFTKW